MKERELGDYIDWPIPEVTWVAGFLSHKIGGGVIWVETDRPRTGNRLVIRPR